MNILIDAASTRGTFKTENQDRCIANDMMNSGGLPFFWGGIEVPVSEENWTLAAVCDGVTHSVKPALCAEVYLQTFQEAYRRGRFDGEAGEEEVEDLVSDILEEAMGRLAEKLKAAGTSDKAVSASTLSLVLIRGSRLLCFNLGDSPVFLVQNGQMTRISELQANPEQPNMITGYVSNYLPPIAGAASWHPFHENDVLLICSDGVAESLIDDTMLELLTVEELPALALVEAAEYVSTDNLTALVVRKGGGEDGWE